MTPHRLIASIARAIAFSLAVALAAPVLADDPISRDRMEKLLADGDDAIATAVLRRNIDDALPFIDQYMEGGLKIIESGGSMDDAMKSYRLGVRFAQLADQAAPGAGFTEYATNFASWSPAEQKVFRQGQADYKKGQQLFKSDPAQATARLRNAASLAESIGDTWGVAMAFGAVARAELEQGHADKVEEAARRANEVNTKLHLRLALVRVLVTWGDSQEQLQPARGGGTNIYSYAWNQLRDSDSPELRLEVMNKFTQCLDRGGQADAARDIRARFAATAAPAPAADKPAGGPSAPATKGTSP